ncbi:hypothetical protein M1L60_11690 [Actinoplanes sp. TRM 88003]|uniref:ATP synthase F0 subunit B n=1 Tax=Paractinoplanes aksuensis TaxID=2939490 RepID=A0ABT1DMI3_9ACTN|nr:hypothetical protein [Actinoplanes aksuensis]MCO8271255.1 hypothetical protein [Actinoplanes aksuensis]
MSDVPSGVRRPDDTYPLDVPPTPGYPADTYATEAYATTVPVTDTTYGGSDDNSSGAKEKAKEVAAQTGQASKEAAADVKDTAKEQAARVGHEAKAQASNLASEVRGRVNDQARTQNDKLVSQIRDTADQLDEMRGDRGDTPAAAVVSRVAEGGRQFADYLDRNGPDGVLREVQDFARRRPGAFLATALAAGFVVGRLGKVVAKADPDAGDTVKPSTDSFVSRPTPYSATETTVPVTPPPVTPDYNTGPGYASTTEYSSTGTGTPSVREEYVVESPERLR